tara:strand:- start:40 stop:516 length:477 start_codon:yes stop_codon:yes gene_type:complete
LKYKSLVITGNLKKDFSRLIQLIYSNIDLLPKPILIQYGHSIIKNFNKYNDQIEYKKFIDNKEVLLIMKEVDVIVAHCGAGIILEALSNEKKPYIVPRKKKFDEHIDDHQTELYDLFIEKNLIFDINDLQNNNKKLFNKNSINNKYVNDYIKNYIDEI